MSDLPHKAKASNHNRVHTLTCVLFKTQHYKTPKPVQVALLIRLSHVSTLPFFSFHGPF